LLATLKLAHLVAVSANVISVTQHRRSGDHVHQFEMLAVLKCVVIKFRIFSTVIRQLAFTWSTVCTETVVRRLKSYHPSTIDQDCVMAHFSCIRYMPL